MFYDQPFGDGWLLRNWLETTKKKTPRVYRWKRCLDTKAQLFSRKHFLPTPRKYLHHAFTHPVGHPLVFHSFIHSFISYQRRPYYITKQRTGSRDKWAEKEKKKNKEKFLSSWNLQLNRRRKMLLNHHTNIEFTNCDQGYKWTAQETMQHVAGRLV